VAISLVNLGKVYYDDQKPVEAEAVLSRAVSIFMASPVENQPEEYILALADADYNLALIKRDEKEYAEAEKYLKSVLVFRAIIEGTNHPDLVVPLRTYAELLRYMKRPVEAAKMEARAKAIETSKR
jgi:tetratricopeptide (TPR) repeat protein